jgi:hypothetical protein
MTVKGSSSRPTKADPDTLRGTAAALKKAFAGPAMLVDFAADAAFAATINRLRGRAGEGGQ